MSLLGLLDLLLAPSWLRRAGRRRRRRRQGGWRHGCGCSGIGRAEAAGERRYPPNSLIVYAVAVSQSSYSTVYRMAGQKVVLTGAEVEGQQVQLADHAAGGTEDGVGVVQPVPHDALVQVLPPPLALALP